MRADLSRSYILSFLSTGVPSTPNIGSCACASTTRCKNADYLKLKEKIVTFVSFLSAPKLMTLFNQINCQKSSVFFKFLTVSAKKIKAQS